MKPEIWGPRLWSILHIITMEYPNNPTNIDKNNMKAFFESLGPVLPCNKCKNNFTSHLQKNPLSNDVLSSRTQLVKWSIDVHNDVNKLTGKPVLSHEDAFKHILGQYEENWASWWFTVILAIIFVIIIIYGGYLLWNKYYGN